MKIVVPYFNDVDPVILSNWVNHYKEYVRDIPAVLMHKDKISSATKDIWPYEYAQIVHDISFLDKFNEHFCYVTPLWYADTIRMQAYETCGDCIAVDYDAIFKKPITTDVIPNCDWGLVPFSRESYNTIQIYEYNMFQEIKNVKACNVGVQIFRKGYYKEYCNLFSKYIYKVQDLILPSNYTEHINCLCHKINNGVFIQPEWNTMWDDYNIQDPYIKHYYLPTGKQRIIDDLRMKSLLSL